MYTRSLLDGTDLLAANKSVLLLYQKTVVLVGWLLNVPATCGCIKDGSAQTVVRAATLR